MKVETNTSDGLALPILSALPEGCVAFTVADTSCEPIVRGGERVAVDVTDREAKEGALYLRRYTSSRKLAIVEALKLRCIGNPQGFWLLGPHRRYESFPAALAHGAQRVFCDGPFDLESLRGRIVGRVVAILDGAAGPGADMPLPVLTMERGTYALIPVQ